MRFKSERNSQTCFSIHHSSVCPGPDPGNSLTNLNGEGKALHVSSRSSSVCVCVACSAKTLEEEPKAGLLNFDNL